MLLLIMTMIMLLLMVIMMLLLLLYSLLGFQRRGHRVGVDLTIHFYRRLHTK